MRSRSNSLEDTPRARPQLAPGDPTGPRTPSIHDRHGKPRREPPDTGTIQRNHRAHRNHQPHPSPCAPGPATAKGPRKDKGRDLSKDDLVFLLSLLEGELQARDEVITVLKADKMDLALLEANYGFVTPHKVLQALQRDGLQGKTELFQEDIYERPMVELDRLVDKQRETHRRMLEQLLMVERSHKQALHKLEDEKKNHEDFMKKSDDFTNLLEQERERLKLLIDQEKAYQERKEEEHDLKLSGLKEELTKLKSFALMVVDEQQRLSEQLRLQSSKVHEATASASQAQEELSASLSLLQQEQDKCCRLEEQLRDQASRHHADADAMTTKLSLEDAHNRALRQKMSALSRTLDELQENNKTLRRAEEELLELRDKISRGECGPTCGSSSLVSELEELRKRVLEMEGKDEELVRMEDHCRDLNKKLQKESVQAQNLKAEVDKLNGRIMDLEKLEDAFSKSKQECGALKGSLDKERTVSKLLLGELETLRGRVRELEEAETQLAQSETGLKEDLCKLKTLTVMLVDERKAAGEKLKQMENRVHSSTGKLQAEQDKVTTVTERLIEESRKALRSKAELEERVCGAVRERDDLRTQLSNEEQRSADLESKISLMKRRLQALETVEREYLRNKASENIKGPVTNRFQQEDNKVKELTQEVERLRSKLKDLKAVEGDSFKTEEFELLEKRFASEQEKAKTLMEELEISKKELSKYQLAEKKECNQETVLYKRLKEEEAKASHLSREVAALKEKIHEYMGTEDSMCRMKSDHSGLQRRLTQQEVRNKELSREMEGLTRELERYRRFSKSLRPGMNGRRFSDLHVATKEVQTVPEDFLQQAMVPLECAVVNGKLYDGHEESAVFSNGLQSDKHTLNKVNERTSSARRARTPLSNDLPRQNSGGDVVWSPGQPLTIKVTPDHGHTTAMLEISSPTSDPPPSFTSTAVIPTTGAPAKPRITIIQSASPAHPRCRAPDEPLSPDRSDSPFSRPTTPERAASPLENTTTAAANTTTAITTTAITTMGPGHAFFRVQRSDSQGSNVITAEDNKIHIHLGPQFLQERRTLGSCGAVSTPPMSPVRGSGKITSSLVIKPSSSPVQRPAQVTIPLEAFRRPGPTRIPKPRSSASHKGSCSAPSGGQATLQARQSIINNNNNSNPNLMNRRL